MSEGREPGRQDGVAIQQSLTIWREPKRTRRSWKRIERMRGHTEDVRFDLEVKIDRFVGNPKNIGNRKSASQKSTRG